MTLSRQSFGDYGSIECTYITMDAETVTVSCETDNGKVESFEIPLSRIENTSDIDVFTDLMELMVERRFLDSTEIKYV